MSELRERWAQRKVCTNLLDGSRWSLREERRERSLSECLRLNLSSGPVKAENSASNVPGFDPYLLPGPASPSWVPLTIPPPPEHS